ncbi:HNH endonuclease signature motif containing protein [Petropleomorpha daqingensis]|uniref:HNH nuclease domain-containing protein n=1 Tax=Petropleomorpha daqingensis TaxID=2026353 RepID=A0A853CC10_9ACTN|nr:HNH endonuclease signature motif containing protein [Petropleomorpha daqingensis]NYJ04877.1 hypothetical protein [Petropleomorpha daqingensis]
MSSDHLHALSGPELLDRTRDLVEAVNRAQAELARTVRVADSKRAFAGDGQKTAQSWLRGHGRLSKAAASQVVRNGRALEQLPDVEEAHAAGRLTADQVEVIAQITAPKYARLITAQGGSVAAVGQVLGRFAVDRPHADLTELVHQVLQRLDQDGPEPDPTEERFLTLVTHADGSVTGRFHLDPLGAQKVQAALEAHRQADRPAGDQRTLAQQQADALVQWADNTLAAGTAPLLRRTRPQVAVKIGSEDLADPGTGRGAATLGFGGVVSAAKARQVACDAELRRYLIAPDGELLDLGRSQRLATPALRKAVELRDEACVFAGCDGPAWWCDVHHVVHWLFGGETSLDNSALLCERHHTQVHHGFTIQRDPAGRWHTYRPDGTEILTIRPEPTDAEELSRAG